MRDLNVNTDREALLEAMVEFGHLEICQGTLGAYFEDREGNIMMYPTPNYIASWLAGLSASERADVLSFVLGSEYESDLQAVKREQGEGEL